MQIPEVITSNSDEQGNLSNYKSLAASQPAPTQKKSPVKFSSFEILDKLGEGSFGKVHRVKHIATGKLYAMKSINK
jgi:serine/threonine protein kinase